MDYAEEQTTELDTLSYIFPDELTVVTHGPPAVFRIAVHLDDEDPLVLSLKHHAAAQGFLVKGFNEHAFEDYYPSDNDDDGDDKDGDGDDSDDDDGEAARNADRSYQIFHIPSLVIEFKYTPTYPDTLPEMRFRRVRGIHADDVTALHSALEAHGTENLGMAMVFAVVSHAKEVVETLARTRMEAEEHAREQRILAEEEAERERYRGTLVTVESFTKWRTGFYEEALRAKKSGKVTLAMEAALAVHGYHAAGGRFGGKLTGRQLFEKDQTLMDSDNMFLEEGDVAVDVELFDGLEIDDDEDEDGEGQGNQVLAGFTEDD
ncbi:RWD domain-containing protein [Entophlyctis helioformis]|nr:RWD domain-containing protein [Entophlyctis helioformis]